MKSGLVNKLSNYKLSKAYLEAIWILNTIQHILPFLFKERIKLFQLHGMVQIGQGIQVLSLKAKICTKSTLN